MKCPDCKKDFGAEHGLRVHRSRIHGFGHTVKCGVCDKGLASPQSLESHGYHLHGDTHARKDWMTQRTQSPAPAEVIGPVPIDQLRRELQREPFPSEPIVAAEPVADGNAHVPTRRFPAQDDRGNAVGLAGLPWMTWPATVEQCDDALNGIAIGLERTQIASPFWLSLRTYVTALRKRLVGKVAA